MISGVLSLIQTLFDIILLRKGPDAIPRATILFIVGLAMWVLSGFALVVFFDGFDITNLTTGLLTACVGWLCYALLLNIAGKSSRLLQTLTSLAGCGALLTAAFIASNALLEPILGAARAIRIAYFVLLWSVPVEGHIISRAIDRPWFVGLMFALAVFMLQIYLETIINPVNPVERLAS